MATETTPILPPEAVGPRNGDNTVGEGTEGDAPSPTYMRSLVFQTAGMDMVETPAEDVPTGPVAVSERQRELVARDGLTDQQSQRQIAQEATTHTMRQTFKTLTGLLVTVLLLLALLQLGVFVWVVYAYFKHDVQACDVPLRLYIQCAFGFICFMVVKATVMSKVEVLPARPALRLVLCYGIPQLMNMVCLYFGVYWVLYASTTCHATYPLLYKPVHIWIVVQLTIHILSVLSAPAAMLLFYVARRGWLPSSGGAPDIVIKGLPRVKFDHKGARFAHADGSHVECTICLEDFTGKKGMFSSAKDICEIPRCKHLFHKECLSNWLKAARTCPLCRLDVTATTDDV